MYNDNPTIQDIEKTIDESKQGSVFYNDYQIDGEKLFYIESYGCQMNFSDSEIVASVLAEHSYAPTRDIQKADLILINTCSIRENAEENVRKRLRAFDKVKQNNPSVKVGVLGCMAERLKKRFLEEEKLVDLVVGPDAYRDLPNLIGEVDEGNKGINVLLSREETYSDISPVRLDSNGISGYVTIMRGCDNMCTFCVVPFTRGRERSRDAFSIIAESQDLFNKGYRDITLLGQNVDSYKWENPETQRIVTFAELLVLVASIHPDLRVRFSTSHPKDINDEVLFAIRDHENICKHIHLPVQSGNSRILELMNRTYDREWYKNKIDRIYELIPDCSISSDIIAGFCSETEEEHQDNISIIRYSNFYLSYMFFYSERPGTLAERKFADDVPLDVKKRRLKEIMDVQGAVSEAHHSNEIGKIYKVLIQGKAKTENDYKGRNSQNKMIVFPILDQYRPGDYVNVKVHGFVNATLLGKIIHS